MKVIWVLVLCTHVFSGTACNRVASYESRTNCDKQADVFGSNVRDAVFIACIPANAP